MLVNFGEEGSTRVLPHCTVNTVIPAKTIAIHYKV